MKKILLSILLSALAFAAQAQRLVIGEKAPELRIAEWVDGKAAAAGKARLIDFFHSSNAQSIGNLEKLNTLAGTYGEKLNIIVVSQEGMEKFQPFVSGKDYAFYAGLDEGGKTFSAYGVRFVPFAALVDARGRLVWTGNIANLTDDTLQKAF